MSDSLSLQQIQHAAAALEKVILHTPMVRVPWLNEKLEKKLDGHAGRTEQTEVYLKLENLQLLSSFKARGAYIKLSQLTKEEQRKGVIAMSAGNHAQGVAYHARALGIPATIVLPRNTPFAKIESTQKLGCTLIMEGQNLHEAAAFASELAVREGLTLIHPYDDPAIIAGQGTVALEMLADVPDLDILIIPIGGGGLAAGMAIAAKALNPKIEIFGVEAAYCPSMAQVLYPERNFILQTLYASPLAEGIAVKSPGVITREILRRYISDILIVSEEQIESAIEDLLILGKLTVEGAGAAGVAAFLEYPHLFVGRKVGMVICGGNIDSRLLSSLLLRGLVRQGKLVRLRIDINDAPGVLGEISRIIGQAGGNIFEVSHQRLFNHITVKMAELDAVIETHDDIHAQTIIDTLQNNGFRTQLVD